jgi:hypothetical protein
LEAIFSRNKWYSRVVFSKEAGGAIKNRIVPKQKLRKLRRKLKLNSCAILKNTLFDNKN